MAEGWSNYFEVSWRATTAAGKEYSSHARTLVTLISAAELNRIMKKAMDVICDELEKADAMTKAEAECPKCKDYMGKCPYCGSPRPGPRADGTANG